MKSLSRSLLFALPVLGLLNPTSAWAQSKVLFDAMHAQTAGNADWVMDEDTCGVAQRYPTPAQSGITATTPETYWGGAYSAFGVGASSGQLNLSNSGEAVSVRNAAGTTINAYTYSSTLSGTDGVSMNRGPDTSASGSFVLHTSLSTLTSSAGKRANGIAF